MLYKCTRDNNRNHKLIFLSKLLINVNSCANNTCQKFISLRNAIIPRTILKLEFSPVLNDI